MTNHRPTAWKFLASAGFCYAVVLISCGLAWTVLYATNPYPLPLADAAVKGFWTGILTIGIRVSPIAAVPLATAYTAKKRGGQDE